MTTLSQGAVNARDKIIAENIAITIIILPGPRLESKAHCNALILNLTLPGLPLRPALALRLVLALVLALALALVPRLVSPSPKGNGLACSMPTIRASTTTVPKLPKVIVTIALRPLEGAMPITSVVGTNLVCITKTRNSTKARSNTQVVAGPAYPVGITSRGPFTRGRRLKSTREKSHTWAVVTPGQQEAVITLRHGTRGPTCESGVHRTRRRRNSDTSDTVSP